MDGGVDGAIFGVVVVFKSEQHSWNGRTQKTPDDSFVPLAPV